MKNDTETKTKFSSLYLVLERLIREYGNSVFRMCYLYLRDYYLAENATKKTFIKAMKFYDSFLHNFSEKRWLIRIALNSCKNIMRTRWFRFPMINIDDQQNIVVHDFTGDVIEKIIMEMRP